MIGERTPLDQKKQRSIPNLQDQQIPTPRGLTASSSASFFSFSSSSFSSSSSSVSTVVAIFHTRRAPLTPKSRTVTHLHASPPIEIGVEDCSWRRTRRRRRTYCTGKNTVSSSTNEIFVRVFKGSRGDTSSRTSSRSIGRVKRAAAV